MPGLVSQELEAGLPPSVVPPIAVFTVLAFAAFPIGPGGLLTAELVGPLPRGPLIIELLIPIVPGRLLAADLIGPFLGGSLFGGMPVPSGEPLLLVTGMLGPALGFVPGSLSLAFGFVSRTIVETLITPAVRTRLLTVHGFVFVSRLIDEALVALALRIRLLTIHDPGSA